MLLDITDRKRAEQAIKQLNGTLEQRVEERTRQMTQAFTELGASEEQFRMLVQGVTDYAIFMLDPKGFMANWKASKSTYACRRMCGRAGSTRASLAPRS
jgi:hypothetical protein